MAGRARLMGGRTAAALALAAGAVALPLLSAAPAVATPPAEVSLDGPVIVLDAATVPGDAVYLARGPQVVRLVPGSAPQLIDLPEGTSARALAVAPDGTLWFGGTGVVGTITPAGVITTKPLADPTRSATSLAIGNDGAVWALTAGSGWAHLERGTTGGAMVPVALPDAPLGNYTDIVAGGSGAILALGPTSASVTAAGTFTSLSGMPPGTINDVERIGTDAWAATTSGLVEISAADTVTTYGLGQVLGGTPDAVSGGPGGSVWYTASGTDGSGSNLGHVGPSGPDHVTVLSATPLGASELLARELTPDPSADRLWAAGRRATDVKVTPFDLTKPLTTITVDDPGPQSFGVATTATAHVTPWNGGASPTGTITFSSLGVVLGTAPVQADGSASTTIHPTYGGLHLRATYSGDPVHPVGWSTAQYRSVADSATAVTITGPAKPWRPGNLTFSVTVTSPTGAKPTGSVTVGNSTKPVSGGLPTTFTTTAYPGQFALKADFQGDLGYTASTATTPTATVSWDTDEENYVTGAYLRLFGRLPDPSGRTYWSTKVRSGLNRDRFALAQVATSEYRRTLAKRNGLVRSDATVAQAKPVVDAMATTTVRELLVAYWADGKRVTQCVDSTAPTVPSGTFMCWAKVISLTFAGHGTADDYAHALSYGNTPTGRTALAKELVYSDHAVQAVVSRAYGSYLDRAPDPSGLGYWTRKIQKGMREEGVEARVLGSDEFYGRTHLAPASR